MNVLLETESRELAEEVGQDPHALDDILPGREAEDFPYLRYIDPYGDTTFNRWQMEPFLQEWVRLYDKATSIEQTSLLRRIEEMGKKCRTDPSYFHLRFCGD